MAGFRWTRDGKYVAYVKDNDGDENFNLYAVDPSAAPAAGRPGASVATRSDRTEGRPRDSSTAPPKSDPDTLYIGINEPRQGVARSLQDLKSLPGEKTLVRQEYGEDRRVVFRS